MQTTLIIILAATTLYLLTHLYHTKLQGRAPWQSTPKAAQNILLNHITLEPGQIFAELGAGTGQVARRLAKKYPTNQIYAYEISYLPFLLGSLLAGRYPNLNFISGDIIKADLNMVDNFYVFTNDQSMSQLAHKLKKHPKPATLYSYHYQLPNHEISQTLNTTDQAIHIYHL